MPHFRKVVNVRYVCRHCLQPITAYKGGVWKNSKGLKLCSSSPTRQHQRDEYPSAQ